VSFITRVWCFSHLNHFFGPIKFPFIQTPLENDYIYPKIDPATMQKVAIERCDVPHEVATLAVVLQPEQGDGGSTSKRAAQEK
jgi:hypothetical protein